jgi:glucose/arabinose dehydrogenase
MRQDRAMRLPRRLSAIVIAAGSLLAGCADDRSDVDDADAPGSNDDLAVVVTTTTVAAGAETAATAGTAPATTVTSAAATSTPATPAPTAPPTAPPTPPPPMGDPVVAFADVVSLDQPLDLAWRAGDPTLYVVEQGGRVVAVDTADEATNVVLDITALTNARGEQGLLGLAFAPAGHRAYVNYTDVAGDTVIAEYAVADDGTFDPTSQRVLLQVDQPYANHNGGDLEFGPDALLYIGLGDGGSGGDPERRALNTSTVLGKLLRIDPTPSGDLPYTVPADNPFVGVEGARPEIWSIGLRNPWKFTFDPVTRDLWIADVGQNQFEEIDYVPAPTDGSVAGRGLSFGWSAYEGTERYNDDQPADGHVAPVLTYAHGTTSCSISGGAPYRGASIPELSSGYVYSDYCSGSVSAFDVAGGRNVPLGETDPVTSIVAGPDQELYVISSDGPVRRIVPA